MSASIGRVLFYLAGKGYGYLRLEGTLEEFHFRREHLKSAEVMKGDLVHFVLRRGKQGYYADAVALARTV